MHALESILHYQFNNASLLKQALTHSSRINTANNQRLEFLGDSVLSLIIAELLYQRFPQEKEGELARRHAALVCGEAITQVANSIALGNHLIIAAGEEATGGRENASNLEDACEALIGALYLDGGLEAAKPFVLTHWEALVQHSKSPPKDAKTALQEWAQGLGKPIPAYTMIESEGPAHAPLFTIQVEVEGFPAAQAQAKSKRAAEQLAAQTLLTNTRHEP